MTRTLVIFNAVETRNKQIFQEINKFLFCTFIQNTHKAILYNTIQANFNDPNIQSVLC